MPQEAASGGGGGGGGMGKHTSFLARLEVSKMERAPVKKGTLSP